MLKLCTDGYVRLSLDALLSARFVHLHSGLDIEGQPAFDQDCRQTTISGYTEWMSVTQPAITLGWDWRLAHRHGQPCCVRSAFPRSNIMLIGRRRRDVGPMVCLRAVTAVVDALVWQERTLRAIVFRYGY